ncbi:MarC family protein [Candidatus Woesearchaeota archaeon]|nr:MarC family protein [Candidatus Woesearchaeota archaeon]
MVSFDLALIIQIFILLNPFSSFPFLLSAYENRLNVRFIAAKSVIVAFIIAISITFVGPLLFKVFGITLDSFRIAGGIVLLLLGIEMIRPQHEEHPKSGEVNSLITLIATPLLTGPATISFITIKAYEIGKTPVLINLFIAFILVGITFMIFSLLVKKINATVIDIISRIMGLFLTAVGIEMITKGVEEIIKIAL